MIELAAAVIARLSLFAVAVLGFGLVIYLSFHGFDRAVLLIVVAAIMAIHALGLMDYRPSQAELEAMQERAR